MTGFNVAFNVPLQLPDDGLRNETCRSSFSVLMYKFYISALVGIIIECVCSFRYPVCNVHGPYRHLWPTRLYNIFPHCLINAKILEKKIDHKLCIDFPYNFETFLILRRTERDIIKSIYRSSYKLTDMLSDLKET